MSFFASKLAEAFCDAFAVDAAMIALVPGGCLHIRGISEEHGGQRPYATVQVVPGDKEFQSNYTTLQSFAVVCRIYAQQTTMAAGEIAAYLSQADFNKSVYASLPARVLGVYPSPESLDLDPQQKLGQDVVIAVKAWTVLLHYVTHGTPASQIGNP